MSLEVYRGVGRILLNGSIHSLSQISWLRLLLLLVVGVFLSFSLFLCSCVPVFFLFLKILACLVPC